MAETYGAEARLNEFHATLRRIEAEGAQAFADGLERGANPYVGHPERHYATSWTGGWAQACLGIWQAPDSHHQAAEDADPGCDPTP